MGVDKNTIVLFREIQKEGRLLLAKGVNPKVSCINREHQQNIERKQAGIKCKRGRRLSETNRYLLLCDIYYTACELRDRGAGKVKFGCLDRLYQERVETGKTWKEQRKNSNKSPRKGLRVI